jgi:hypothetical protein
MYGWNMSASGSCGAPAANASETVTRRGLPPKASENSTRAYGAVGRASSSVRLNSALSRSMAVTASGAHLASDLRTT